MKNVFVTKGDLAAAYFPYIDPRSARHKLMGVIADDSRLMEALEESGYRRNCKYLSPRMVEMIVERLGNPWK